MENCVIENPTKIEYKTAKGWAILVYTVLPLLVGLFGFLGIMPFLDNSNISLDALWFLAPISLGMITLTVVGLLDTIKGKFVIDNERIFTISTFSKRELTFDEIKGYRVTDHYILVEPTISEKKKIKISTYYGKTDEIINWLDTYYPDLDVQAAAEEHQEILNNEEFGRTTEEREVKLSRARNTAKVLNWIGGLTGIWTLFWAEPYEYAILTSLAVPIVALIALKFSDGLLRIDEKNLSAYPSIFWAIFSPSLGLGLRALLDFNIFDYSNVWILASTIVVTFLAVVFIGNREFTFKQAKDYFSVLGISLVIFSYSFGAIITLNCYYDSSESEIYSAKIINKRISTGKTTTYYLELTRWGNQATSEEVSVSEQLYHQLDQDDEVTVYFNQGQFDIPWFFVTE